MYTEISDSLSNSLSSVQLSLFDFGMEDAKERVVKRALNQSLIKNMNDKVQNLDDNHFSYVNPVCPHCIKKNKRGHIIKKGFRSRKIRINGTEKLNPYDNHDEEELIKRTIFNINVSSVKNTLTQLDEEIDREYITNFVNKVKTYNIQEDKNILIYLRKYKCNSCGHYFQTELSSVYDRYKRYAKSFFDKIDEITSYSHYKPSKLQEIIKTTFNREINLKTLFDWTKITSKMNRSTEYDDITYVEDENLILNVPGLGSGDYNYDEQYLSEERKDVLRLTLIDAHLEVPIAEQIIKRKTTKKWKLNRSDVLNFLKKATKGRKFNTLITDGRPMYKSIAKELNVELQFCIFHAIKNNNQDAYDVSRSKTKTPIEKMTILSYTSQINEIVRQLSLKDATDLLNEMKDINTTIGLPKINQDMLERINKNFHELTTHLRIEGIPRTNNNAELTYRITLTDSEKKEYKTIEGLLSRLITNMKNKTYKKVTEM